MVWEDYQAGRKQNDGQKWRRQPESAPTDETGLIIMNMTYAVQENKLASSAVDCVPTRRRSTDEAGMIHHECDFYEVLVSDVQDINVTAFQWICVPTWRRSYR